VRIRINNSSSEYGGNQYHVSRAAILEYVKTLILDDYTLSVLVRSINECPDGGLGIYLKNIDDKIKRIRSDKK
jgi:hypothetical protein